MATIKGKGAPKNASWDIPEGEQVFVVKKAEALPRTNPNVVKMQFVNADGGTINNTYKLDEDGGYAAFYYLMLKCYDIDLSDPDAGVDIEALVGTFVTLDIKHKVMPHRDDPERTVTFNNIKAAVGPGEPFETTTAAPKAAASGGNPWD